jgi:hypothetical protein
MLQYKFHGAFFDQKWNNSPNFFIQIVDESFDRKNQLGTTYLFFKIILTGINNKLLNYLFIYIDQH